MLRAYGLGQQAFDRGRLSERAVGQDLRGVDERQLHQQHGRRQDRSGLLGLLIQQALLGDVIEMLGGPRGRARECDTDDADDGDQRPRGKMTPPRASAA
ncbi:MAG: hypothetical protein NVSMB48_03010 [Marmoricola sp.]